jgi:hypothetical protein
MTHADGGECRNCRKPTWVLGEYIVTILYSTKLKRRDPKLLDIREQATTMLRPVVVDILSEASFE